MAKARYQLCCPACRRLTRQTCLAAQPRSRPEGMLLRCERGHALAWLWLIHADAGQGRARCGPRLGPPLRASVEPASVTCPRCRPAPATAS